MAGIDEVQETRPIELAVYAGAFVYVALFVYSLTNRTETTILLADVAFGLVIGLWGVDLLTVTGAGQRLRAAGGLLLLGGVLQIAVAVVGTAGIASNAPVVFVLLGVVLYISDQSNRGAGR